MATSGVPNPYTYVSEQSDGAWAGQFNGVVPVDSGGAPTLPEGDETGSSPGPDEQSFRWATVASLVPLRIVLDGETTMLPITPENLVDPDNLRVAGRVWVQLYGKRVIILGAAGGGADIAVPLGGILEFGGTAPPNANFMFCRGQSLLRADYPGLFGVIGTAYGAADGTHFNLPDKRDRFGVGSGGAYGLGTTGGTSSYSLSLAQLPTHTHTFNGGGPVSGITISSDSHNHSFSGSTSDNGTHSHGYVNASSQRFDMNASAGSTCNNGSFSSDTGSAGGHSHSLSGSIGSDSHSHTLTGGSATVSGSTNGTGSSASVNNMPPYVGMNYIIRVL